MSPTREEFKRYARELATDSIVTDSLTRLLEQVIPTVVKIERARCVNLTREAAKARANDGDPEGADVIRDLANLMGRG